MALSIGRQGFGFAGGLASGLEGTGDAVAGILQNKQAMAENKRQFGATQKLEQRKLIDQQLKDHQSTMKGMMDEYRALVQARGPQHPAALKLAQTMASINSKAMTSIGAQYEILGVDPPFTTDTVQAQSQALAAMPTQDELNAQAVEQAGAVAGATAAATSAVERDPENVQARIREAATTAGATARATAAAQPDEQITVFDTTAPEGQRFSGALKRPDGRITDLEGNLLPANFVEAPIKVDAQSASDLPSLSTGALTDVQKSLTQMDDEIQILDDLATNFDPDMTTVGSDIGAFLLNTAERVGIDVGEDKEKFLTDKTLFKQRTFRVINATIRRITGAQMSNGESKRIMREVPNPSDGKTQYETKMREVLRQLKLARARRVLLMKEDGTGEAWTPGTDEEPPIGLNEVMPRIQRMAEDRLEEIMNGDPSIPEATARSMATTFVRKELGL